MSPKRAVRTFIAPARILANENSSKQRLGHWATLAFHVNSRPVLQEKSGTLGSYSEVSSQTYCLVFPLPLETKVRGTLIPSTKSQGFAMQLIGSCRRQYPET